MTFEQFLQGKVPFTRVRIDLAGREPIPDVQVRIVQDGGVFVSEGALEGNLVIIQLRPKPEPPVDPSRFFFIPRLPIGIKDTTDVLTKLVSCARDIFGSSPLRGIHITFDGRNLHGFAVTLTDQEHPTFTAEDVRLG